MTILLLGTGGAEGIPAAFGNSRVSAHARERGGRDVRSRSAALVDGQLQLDFGPDTWGQLVREGISATDWCAVVYTHADADHFAIEELQYALYPFTDGEEPGFVIYGNNLVAARIRARYPDWPFEVVTTKSFVPFSVCDYRVTPVKAKHGSPDEDTQNLLVQSEGKSLLYATDTGVWDEPTWEFLSGIKLDGLVLECTEGFELTPYNGHLDIEEFAEVVERLRKLGVVHNQTKVVSTHHSHNGKATYDELVEALGKIGAIAGYDGLRIEL